MKFQKNIISAAIILATMTLTACDSSDDDKNVAPTDITLSSNSVLENTSNTVIGTLSATDENSTDTFTFTVSDERFTVVGNELTLAENTVFDYETEQSIDIEVVVTDSGALSFTKTLTIEITDALDTYAFDSKFITDDSSVSYTGQIARHALIAELAHYIGNDLKSELDDGTLMSRDAVIAKLNKYYRTSDLQYDNFPITFMSAKQTYITDISSSPKNLSGKMAGNDTGGQHKDWNDGEFAGWGTKGSTTPEGLIDILFGQLADNAEQHLNGVVRQSVTGDDITKVYLNSDGTDLKQLIQKLLLVGITYSQATDDYLGHETEGKGLTTDNIGQDGGSKPYSTLEHQFDEGFGYFGATPDYLAYSDTEIAGKVTSDDNGRSDWNGKHDSNNDGEIDLTSEVIFGIAANAAKRDLGTASNTSPTDYTAQIMNAFISGRKIINDNVGSALSTQQLEDLKAQRDIIADGWERALATTVVHYINEVHSDLSKFGTDDFNFEDTAKHYSELKGFALGLQFNPYSKVTDEQFQQFHTLVADKPVLDSEDNVTAYQVNLLAARDIIETALSLDNENVQNW
ncbi:cadherin repeat domain-containing protein [Psychrosphaera sp. F3M07]|uniref:DUF4856 domain-containing protein n=1 Tax=Psychrosphaera sp. F3M07 TaxID=2841560 RepID=UPI001C08948D|nr:DUF4856 domain-containing protein [Psychrosphaera sp. F3M07]MBU2916768.1 cadherin repeat domain-containing protein [Psychrosphaera sp. F3M07]